MSASDLHHARVMLAQARHFRKRGDTFCLVLLEWAGNARRRHMLAQAEQVKRGTPIQGVLFQ